MKYCVDCRFFRGKLTAEDHEFLVKLLRSYHAELMLNSWVKLGQIKKPGGKNVDPDKAKQLKFLNAAGTYARKSMFAFSLWNKAAFSGSPATLNVFFLEVSLSIIEQSISLFSLLSLVRLLHLSLLGIIEQNLSKAPHLPSESSGSPRASYSFPVIAQLVLQNQPNLSLRYTS